MKKKIISGVLFLVSFLLLSGFMGNLIVQVIWGFWSTFLLSQWIEKDETPKYTRRILLLAVINFGIQIGVGNAIGAFVEGDRGDIDFDFLVSVFIYVIIVAIAAIITGILIVSKKRKGILTYSDFMDVLTEEEFLRFFPDQGHEEVIEIDSHELTQKEIKKVRKYYILPVIGIASLISIVVPLALMILIPMINDVFLPVSADIMFRVIVVPIIFAAIYLLMFCVGVLTPKFGMLTHAWKVILKKTEVEMDADADRMCEEIAARSGFELPKKKIMRFILPLSLIAAVTVLGVCVPVMVNTQKDFEAQKEVIEEQYQEFNIYADDFSYISIPDAEDIYQKSNVSVIMNSDTAYMAIDINDTRSITDIGIHYSYDSTRSQEENLEDFQNFVVYLLDKTGELDSFTVDDVFYDTDYFTEDYVSEYFNGEESIRVEETGDSFTYTLYFIAEDQFMISIHKK